MTSLSLFLDYNVTSNKESDGQLIKESIRFRISAVIVCRHVDIRYYGYFPNTFLISPWVIDTQKMWTNLCVNSEYCAYRGIENIAWHDHGVAGRCRRQWTIHLWDLWVDTLFDDSLILQLQISRSLKTSWVTSQWRYWNDWLKYVKISE